MITISLLLFGTKYIDTRNNIHIIYLKFKKLAGSKNKIDY